jgi:hypothetical protein
VTAGDTQSLAVRQGISHFAPGPNQNPLKGSAGNPHPLGTGLLLQTFQVFQPQGLYLFHSQLDLR